MSQEEEEEEEEIRLAQQYVLGTPGPPAPADLGPRTPAMVAMRIRIVLENVGQVGASTELMNANRRMRRTSQQCRKCFGWNRFKPMFSLQGMWVGKLVRLHLSFVKLESGARGVGSTLSLVIRGSA